MPSLLDIRRRVRAVRSTQQITKAMKMVAASKLRRAQERVQHADHLPSFFACLIIVSIVSSSDVDIRGDDISSSAATACGVEPSKNVRSNCRSADWRAAALFTVGTWM